MNGTIKAINNPERNRTMNATNYQQQAIDFLKKHNISMTIELADTQKAPAWAKEGEVYGNRYWIRLFKGLAGRTMTFDFWGSLSDKQAEVNPSEYDVLACCAGDVHCPETFKGFCAEYGLNEDSIRDNQAFRRCDKHARQLRAFFSQSEIQALSEIQ